MGRMAHKAAEEVRVGGLPIQAMMMMLISRAVHQVRTQMQARMRLEVQV
jgi:hypothetical protein